MTNNKTLVRLACNNKISSYFLPLLEHPITVVVARLDYVFSARGVVARARGVDDGAALISPPRSHQLFGGILRWTQLTSSLWELHRSTCFNHTK